jgi:hypothetical protein
MLLLIDPTATVLHLMQMIPEVFSMLFFSCFYLFNFNLLYLFFYLIGGTSSADRLGARDNDANSKADENGDNKESQRRSIITTIRFVLQI